LRLSHSAGSGELLIILYWSGIIQCAQGELRRALESLDTAIEIARLAGQDLGIASYLAIRSVVAAAMGDGEGSLDSALEAVDLTRTVPATLPAAMARLSCTAALLDAGQPDRALGELEPSSLPLRWRPDAYDLIARCHLSLGRPHEPALFAASASPIAADLDLPSTRGAAERATCDIAFTQRRLPRPAPTRARHLPGSRRPATSSKPRKPECGWPNVWPHPDRQARPCSS
jgi:hypothetical protein